MTNDNTPLGRFPVFATTDPEEFRTVAMGAYGARHVELRHFNGTPSRGNAVLLTDITLGYSVCGEALIDFPQGDFARLQFALRGCGAVTTRRTTSHVTDQQACITSPGQSAKIAYGRGFEQFYLRVGTSALERKLAAMLGAPPTGRLEFAETVSLAAPRVQGLWRLIKFLAGQLNEADGRMPPALRAELEQAVVLAFLHATPHNFTALLERDGTGAPPDQVRKAEEYIRAHADQAITIEQLAAVSGISARTLFKGFRRHRGYSPLQFAKRIRLERARELLTDPDATTSVSSVASACGFANLGHFASDYRAAFGELPSTVLARRSAPHARDGRDGRTASAPESAAG